ncbi:flagellar motor stator protein MotA [Pseudoduganella plicata]|uniref:Flagellar motor protein MotA n=1 Tax=Pseudoduganella plicata TaxID=321984 RepID=A0A4P7BBH1_9BURK|nr:flagellar motor stator protein MotA [Pseudoduganella plicata]QBQ35961.1 flagellar motor stator protein MotA [Pseudoduganella plicata]GGY79156.1 flagellar motor protein MotA [Pseudoduganella plicata]
MLVIAGFIVVLASVLGGFALQGGHLAALFQPTELLIIVGAALGAFFVANDARAIRATVAALPTLFQSSRYTKAMYLDLMSLLFELLTKVRKEGMMAAEADVDAPHDSPLFTRYPAIVAEGRILEFITDYLRLMISGNMDAFQIENLMDNEIETYHEDGEAPVHSIQQLAEAMPAFGIVAAVIGVVHTMASVGLPPSELGILIAGALVGTFVGILLSYGFVGPVAALLRRRHAESAKMVQCVKVTLLASLNGYAPALAVEFGRKVISHMERPTFLELDRQVRTVRVK